MSRPSQQQATIENCPTFGAFVQRVCAMSSNAEAVAFEGVIRSRRDACVFILEQRDTYAPPALSASALAKVWTQLGCSIDSSRSVTTAAATKDGANNNKQQRSMSTSGKGDSAADRKAKNALLPNTQSIVVLDSVVTSIEWSSVTVCGKKLNAGGCYANALEMDPDCNAAAWFNLGCWLSAETKEVVKGNARAAAMVSAEEDEERRNGTAASKRIAQRASAHRYGIPKGAATPTAKPSPSPTSTSTSTAASASATATAATNAPDGGAAASSSPTAPTQQIILPAAFIRRIEYTAALSFARAVAIDDQLQGGWLNLGAALALEQVLEKRGALSKGHHPLITIESIEITRAKVHSDGNHNVGYNASLSPQQLLNRSNRRRGGGGAPAASAATSGSKKGVSRLTSGPVTRQFCYAKELEASYRKAATEAEAKASNEAGAGARALSGAGAGAAAENLIGPSSLSSPYYLSNHPEAINSVTFTDSCPSSDEAKAATKKERHERRVSRYRQLAITADPRGPSRSTVRSLAWINLAATFENLTAMVHMTLLNFYVPHSHSTYGGKLINPITAAVAAAAEAGAGAEGSPSSAEAEPPSPIEIALNKRQCLEAALAEDPTIAKAWLNLGTTMEDHEHIIYTGTNAEREKAGADGTALPKQRIGRLQCFMKAIEVSNDSTPSLWMSIATQLFEDLKAGRPAHQQSRAYCTRLPLKSRRRINGGSGNITVLEQRQAVLRERAEKRRARLESERAALEAAATAAASGQAPSLTKAQLDRLNRLHPNTKLSPKAMKNKGGATNPLGDYNEDDDDDDYDPNAPIGVFPTTFDCIDCMEEYLARCPDDGKAWLQLAHMFQYFIEGPAGEGSTGPNGKGAPSPASASVASVPFVTSNEARAVNNSDGENNNNNNIESEARKRRQKALQIRRNEKEARRIANKNPPRQPRGTVDAAGAPPTPAAVVANNGAEKKKKPIENGEGEGNEAYEDIPTSEEDDYDTDDEEDEEEEEEERAPIPVELVVSGFRYTKPREIFAEVARCEPSNGEVWFTLGNYLYYDPNNTDGTMVVRIGRSKRAEQLTYKECYSKAQSLGAMGRFTCCSIM